ncbi:MAG: dicarboxylate/amino acid:cation symporter [Methylococcus sp.]
MKLPPLNTQILIAAFLGILSGLLLNLEGAGSPAQTRWLPLFELTGGVFIDLLKMVVIPLVFTSVATGIASLGGHDSAGRIWLWTLVYYLGTTFLAAALGLCLIDLLEPGKGLDVDLLRTAMNGAQIAQGLTFPEFMRSFLRGIFVNPVKAMAEGSVMPTVVFALLVGAGIARRGERAKALRDFMGEALDLMLIIIGWVMRLAPVGVFALLGHLVATQEAGLFLNLALFVAVIMGALLVHGLIVLPGILYLTTRSPPWAFLRGAQEAMLTAFATCSSAATLAVAMKVATGRLGVAPRVARFVLPLGATLNSDGTALYEAGAALFVANLAGVDLSLSQQIVVCLMAVVASIGAPGLPSAGMVTMIMVLQSVGLPVEAIAILLPMDRLIDTIRTAVNVEGDLVGSIIIHRLVPEGAPENAA